MSKYTGCLTEEQYNELSDRLMVVFERMLTIKTNQTQFGDRQFDEEDSICAEYGITVDEWEEILDRRLEDGFREG